MGERDKRLARLRELSDETDKYEKLLTEEDSWVSCQLDDYMTTMPHDFFKQPLEVINKYLGGHDDVVVTENLRRCLDAYKGFLDICNYEDETVPKGIEMDPPKDLLWDVKSLEQLHAEDVAKQERTEAVKKCEEESKTVWRTVNGVASIWNCEQPCRIEEVCKSGRCRDL